MVITDPPYSEQTHNNVRSRRMSLEDRGAGNGADVRRRVDLGFDHLTAEVRAFTWDAQAGVHGMWTNTDTARSSDDPPRSVWPTGTLGQCITRQWLRDHRGGPS